MKQTSGLSSSFHKTVSISHKFCLTGNQMVGGLMLGSGTILPLRLILKCCLCSFSPSTDSRMAVVSNDKWIITEYWLTAWWV